MAVAFNGSSQYLHRTANLPTNGSFTLAGWARLGAAAAGWQGYLSVGDTASWTYFIGNYGGGGASWGVYANNGGQNTLASTPANGSWVWLALVGSGTGASGLTAYQRLAAAQALESVTVAANTGTINSVRVATSVFDGTDFATCRFQAVKCWDRVLTAAELLVESYYRRVMFPASLNFWWPLDTASDLNDYGGNGRAATAVASPTTADGYGVLRPRRRIFIPAAAAGQTVVVNQATETDTAQPVTWAPKRRLVNQVSETDAAQPITRRKARTLGQPSETDAAQPIAWAPKHRLVAQAAETDLAQAIARAKSKVLGQPSETDLAQPISRGGTITRPVNQVEETDLAQPITARKVKAIAQVAETDTAQAMTRVKSRVLGLVLEIDLAQPVAWAPKARLVAQAEEVDAAQPITVHSDAAPPPAESAPTGGWWAFDGTLAERRRRGRKNEPTNAEIRAAEKAVAIVEQIADETALTVQRPTEAERLRMLERALHDVGVVFNAYAAAQLKAAVERRMRIELDDEKVLSLFLSSIA